MIMILLFIALLPFGLFFLALLPLCMTCKKIQDVEHIDPATGNTVGVFRRGYPDAPSFYHFYRYPKGTEPGQSNNATITEQPIPQQIAFRDRPVLLPDGVSTFVHLSVYPSIHHNPPIHPSNPSICPFIHYFTEYYYSKKTCWCYKYSLAMHYLLVCLLVAPMSSWFPCPSC